MLAFFCRSVPEVSGESHISAMQMVDAMVVQGHLVFFPVNGEFARADPVAVTADSITEAAVRSQIGSQRIKSERHVIHISTVDYVVTDDAGNVYDPHALETGKWYNVTFIGAGVGNYMLWFFEGSATNGTVYVKDVTPITNTGAFTASYYMTVAPYVAGNDTNYAVFARYITDATGINDRAITFNVDAASGDIISMKVQMPRTSGTPDLIIKNAGGSAMSTAITDANCNIISAAQMQLGQWYTVSWTADGSASYTLCAFQGSAANGACLVKDITVTAAPANPFYVPEANDSLVDNVGYYGKVVPVVLGDEVAYMHYIHPTGDGTNQVWSMLHT